MVSTPIKPSNPQRVPYPESATTDDEVDELLKSLGYQDSDEQLRWEVEIEKEGQTKTEVREDDITFVDRYFYGDFDDEAEYRFFILPPIDPECNHITRPHFKEWIDSGVDPEIIRLNVRSMKDALPWEYLMYSEDIPRRNDGRLVDWVLKKYAHIENGGWWCSGVDILKLEDSLWGCFKPDKPRYDDKDKSKVIKYEHPLKSPTSIFALKVPRETWQRISAVMGVPIDGDNFFQWILDHPEIPIAIAEGAKKTAALASIDCVSIGLPGVSNGYRTPKDEEGNKNGDSYLIPEIAKLAEGNRPITLCFDQDSKPKTRETVGRNLKKFGELLEAQGAKVRVAHWNPELGKGIDDLLVSQGKEAVRKILDEALPYAEWLEFSTQKPKKERPSVDDPLECIEEALVFLASACDGASSKDGSGFSKFDAEFGESLVTRIQEGKRLTPKQYKKALDMLGKYENTQLSGFSLPGDDQLEGVLAELEQQFQSQKNENKGKGKKDGDDKPPSPKALADTLYERFRERWAYDLGQGVWRIWNDVIWERRHDKVVQRLLKAQVQSMNINYSKESYIKDSLESLSLLLLKEKWESFDRSQWIAGSNGVLNITTGKVEHHQSGFGFTSVLPHEVRPFRPAQTDKEVLSMLQEECPETHQFFSSSMLGDEQRILKLIAVVAGVIRFRFSKLQRFVHLIGEPGTGKGTFTRLLKDVVGAKNCEAASLTNLHDGSVMARIINAQLLLFPDERKQVGVEWLLKLTGGDDVDYRKVYTEGGSSPFYGSAIVASNNAIFTGDTTGLDRRLCLIPFQNIIPDHQRDADLQDRLKAEVPNLVSVALSMPLSLVDDLLCGRGVGRMPDIRWHEWQMKIEVDKVASFIDEMLVEDEWGDIPASDAFQSYLEWARESNHSSPGSNTFFGGRLGKHLNWLKWDWSKPKTSGRMHYRGFRLRRDGDSNIPTVSEKLHPTLKDTPGIVEPSLRDSSGTVSNPDGVMDRDSRDSFFPNFSEKKVERQETQLPSSPNNELFSVEQKTENFTGETIPTIPNPVPEPIRDSPYTIPQGQYKPSLAHHSDEPAASEVAQPETPIPHPPSPAATQPKEEVWIWRKDTKECLGRVTDKRWDRKQRTEIIRYRQSGQTKLEEISASEVTFRRPSGNYCKSEIAWTSDSEDFGLDPGDDFGLEAIDD